MLIKLDDGNFGFSKQRLNIYFSWQYPHNLFGTTLVYIYMCLWLKNTNLLQPYSYIEFLAKGKSIFSLHFSIIFIYGVLLVAIMKKETKYLFFLLKSCFFLLMLLERQLLSFYIHFDL